LEPLRVLREEVENAYLGANKGPGAARFFGDAGTEYIKKYGGTIEHFAKIGKGSPLPRDTLPTLFLEPPRTIDTP
jgi:hypothetical protein